VTAPLTTPLNACACRIDSTGLTNHVAPHADVCPALQKFSTMSSRFGKDLVARVLVVEMECYSKESIVGSHACYWVEASLRAIQSHAPRVSTR
jgi:hypothetical protein